MSLRTFSVISIVQRLVRKSAKRALTGLIFALALTSTSQSAAGPNDANQYDVIEGGYAVIEDGAYVEGSIRQGGLQPDYKIDLKSEPLASLLKQAKEIGKADLPFWKKVVKSVSLVSEDFFRYNDYENPFYLRVMKKHREQGKDVSLSSYGVCSAGVCREHALVLHFVLRAAGIPNRHVYAQILRSNRQKGYDVQEDHAFNVIEYEGKKWVVDAYYWGFNGYLLKDLLSSGITSSSERAPIAVQGPDSRRVLKIHSFPKIYNPLPPAVHCERALSF